MLARGQSPFPDKAECKRCLTKPCQRLFVGRVYPGKMIFVHRSEFIFLPCHKPEFWMKKEDPDNTPALTDDIIVEPKQKVMVTNPRWKHVDKEQNGSSP